MSKDLEKHLRLISATSLLDWPTNIRLNATVHGRTCESCLGFAAIGAKVSSNFSGLKDIWAEIKRQINQRHDPIMRCLPAEITSHIFSLYTEDINSNFDIMRNDKPNLGPLLLGAVSKHWREIAFGTPQLWTTANVFILFIYEIPHKAKLVNQWLDRSKKLPLSLSITCTEFFDRECDISTFSPLFDVIRNFAPQWHELFLRFSGIFFSAFVGDLTCAPILKTLNLIPTSSFSNPFSLAETPSLKRLVMPRSSFSISQLYIQWNHLTSFEFYRLSIEELLEVLRRAERLVSCSVSNLKGPLVPVAMANSTLTHQSLEDIDFWPSFVDRDGRFNTFLDLLTFPSLKRFKCDCSRQTTFPLDGLLSLFARSHCQLTHFEILGDIITANNILPLLSNQSSITHLDISITSDRPLSNGVVTDIFLEELAPILRDNTLRPGLLPALQSFKYFGYRKFSWASFANFIDRGRFQEGQITSADRVIARSSDLENVDTQSPQKSRSGTLSITFRLRQEDQRTIDPEILHRLNRARDAGTLIDITDNRSPLPYELNPCLRIYVRRAA